MTDERRVREGQGGKVRNLGLPPKKKRLYEGLEKDR